MKKGYWKFDDEVARLFDEIARTNIPHYEDVIWKCLAVAKEAFPDKTTAKIIDVGSALGHTMEIFRGAGYAHVFGVDSSESMHAQSRVKKNLILSSTFPKEHGPFDLVLANWTLHFVKEREKYLSDIFAGMSQGGVLILTDKMESTKEKNAHYHAFKRAQGLTEEEIVAKAAAIEGILIPFPQEWYLETLPRIGFKNVAIIDEVWCFTTLRCNR
jgi:trans-aconitate methyltransferase